MDKVIDFETAKTAREYEALGLDMAKTALHSLDGLAGVLSLDRETGQKIIYSYWQMYLLFSAILAEYCIDFYGMDESDLQRKLQEIVEELHARLHQSTDTNE